MEFRGHTIAKTGPWGQGPALLQTLAILDGFDDRYLDPSTELGAHTILEAQKLALADREAYYGDTDVPLDYLLSAEYCAGRRALIAERASHDFRPGTVPGREPYLPPLRTEYTPPALAGEGSGPGSAGLGVGEPTVAPSGETRGDTCHIDVVDRWGNMVSATPSGGWLQSSPAIPELGFCLGTRLQMTWLEPGTPSTLTPGKRPRTTLTPTLVLRDGQAVTALGSPGGDQQDQWQLPYLLRTIVGGYSPQQAIDAPTFHTTSMPGSFWPRTWEPGGAVVEDRLGEDVIAGLERRGHVVTDGRRLDAGTAVRRRAGSCDRGPAGRGESPRRAGVRRGAVARSGPAARLRGSCEPGVCQLGTEALSRSMKRTRLGGDLLLRLLAGDARLAVPGLLTVVPEERVHSALHRCEAGGRREQGLRRRDLVRSGESVV